MSRFQKQKLIATEGKFVRILDMNTLQDLCGAGATTVEAGDSAASR